MIVKDSIDMNPDLRMDLEQAKRNAQVDRSFTCFKGVGSVLKDLVYRSMWLGEEKKQSEYV